MKIPIFEEILLKGSKIEEIEVLITESRIGKVPCYLNLSSFKTDDIKTIILNIEQVILEQSLHPCFPYPFYIITQTNTYTHVPTIRSVKDLPEHYFKKIKRPNNKELQLLNKLALKVDKIKNLELYKIVQNLKESAIPQKTLYKETKELYFYERLYSIFFEKNKKISTKR